MHRNQEPAVSVLATGSFHGWHGGVQGRAMDKVDWWVALILAVPLSIVANILTGHFQNAWARTSRARAVKQLRRLEVDLQRMENDLQAPTGMILRGVEGILIGTGVIVLCGLLELVSQLLQDLGALPSGFRYLPRATELVLLLQGFRVIDMVTGRIQRARDHENSRKELQETAKRLRRVAGDAPESQREALEPPTTGDSQ